MVIKKELRKIFEEERKRLKLPPIKVKFLNPPPIEYYESLKHWWLFFNEYSTMAVNDEDGSLYVQFNPVSFKNPKNFRRIAKHELYHIYRARHGDKINFFRKYFIDEPASVLYQYTGIRL
ncbi:MAG: hypothetical protein GTN38_00110 [Candidatus Aenigmarchaeota archaeon]|nr:hypothetical protein [Candidatus Aenigmarchaeota archaeon]NIP39908.1 hypothetical protein [Candidatus Aenigmarchaeota archaeon]NIQ17627.1 hypothetical protein [Candidatus Aenigmarchaeota archaeon]NIS72815.1 hypothetical protein [Candidatus Aenigmarchaeota archaeon]